MNEKTNETGPASGGARYYVRKGGSAPPTVMNENGSWYYYDWGRWWEVSVTPDLSSYVETDKRGTPLAPPPSQATGEERIPTHRCKICGALWIDYGDSWSLFSPSCGKCCDNATMGSQIEPLPASPPPAEPGETPRTDAARAEFERARWMTGARAPDGWEFARTLERELSAALSRIDMQRDEFQRILAHADQPVSVTMYAERAIREIERTTPITVDCERLQKRCDALSAEVERLRAEYQWRRVEDGLPEYMTSCLVYCPENKNIYCAYYHFYRGLKDPERKPIWCFFDNDRVITEVGEKVTHWMPLPEPPDATP